MLLRTLATAHDRLSRGSFIAAAGILAIMTAAYCYEVVSRYFFNAPTIWASPLVSYGLCATIFLALPDLTRRGMQVAIDLQDRFVSPEFAVWLLRAMQFISGLACFLAAWITAAQAWSEYQMGVTTNTYLPIPKWWLFILIPYGLFSGGIYFFRQAFGATTAPRPEAISS
jgi:C4-dicarboxylate transporter DctQ subunit